MRGFPLILGDKNPIKSTIYILLTCMYCAIDDLPSESSETPPWRGVPHAAAWRLLTAPPGAPDKEQSGMSDQDAFDRILAALHAATLDDSQWPATSALIDDALGSQGNTLLVGVGPPDDIQVSFVGLYYRGERRPRARARIPDRLPSHRRMHPALPATARQPDRACHRPVHHPGVTDLRRLQRRAPPAARPE